MYFSFDQLKSFVYLLLGFLYLGGNRLAPVFDSDLADDGDLPRLVMKSEVVGDTLGRRRGAWPPPSPLLPPRTPLPPTPPPPMLWLTAPPTIEPASIWLDSLLLLSFRPKLISSTSLSATKSSGPEEQTRSVHTPVASKWP